MDFQILGTLEARDGERAVAVGGTKQRALLALLLLNANRPVSTDRLIDDLWPDSGRDDAAKALQVAVSRLRRVVGTAVVTRAPGYELRVGDGDLDAERFERGVARGRAALARGDPATAATTLREALALWRGPALADLAFHSACQREIARLEELRLAAVEDAIEADLALGRDGELVAEVEAHVDRNPLRERLRGQLMLALYRGGRQADALDVFRTGRAQLVAELGLEPGRGLVDLNAAILAQDRALDWTAPVADVASAPEAPAVRAGARLVGRDDELAALDAVLARASAGRSSLVLIGGEAGIGKSRLLDVLRSRADAAGARVLAGRCWEAGGAPAYWPWVQALRTYVGAADVDELARDPDAAAVISTIVPELRRRCPGLPEPPDLSGDAGRFRLFDATAKLLRSAAATAPVLVTLDDLHAADVPSILLLSFVAREVHDTPVVLAGAYRDAELHSDRELGPALAGLTREVDAVQLAPRGLSADEVGNLVASVAGVQPSEAAVAAIAAETEGNPLFVTEVTRLLAGRGTLGAREGRVPATVKEVIRQRLRGLPEGQAGMLTLAALLGRELDVDALAAVAGRPADEVLDGLHPAFAAGILGALPDDHRRLRFSHALVRDALDDDLPAGERMRLHRQIGDALEHHYGDGEGDEPHCAELAHHFARAGTARDDDRAIDYARNAADRAHRLFAFEEAARQYTAALHALEVRRPADAEGRGRLLLLIGDAWARAGDMDAAKRACLEAAEIGRSAGIGELVVRAALGFGGRFLWNRAASDRRMVPLLEDALRVLGADDSPLRVKILARLATAVRGEDTERRELVIEEAVASARRLGDPALLAYALDARCGTVWAPEAIPACMADAEEIGALGRLSGDLEREFSGHEHAISGTWTLGDRRSARVHLAEMRRLADALHQPGHHWLATSWGAQSLLYEGRFDEAAAAIGRAYGFGRQALPWNALAMRRLQTSVLADLTGRCADFETEARRGIEEAPGYPIFQPVLVATLARLGHTGEVRERLAALGEDDFVALERDETRMLGMALLGEAAAAVGDADRGAAIYDELLPHAALVAVSPVEICRDAISRVLGRLAALLERWDDADRHFADALALNTRIGARPWAAVTAHEHAAALVSRGRPEDRDRAGTLLRQATAAYEEFGMRDRLAEAASIAGGLPTSN